MKLYFCLFIFILILGCTQTTKEKISIIDENSHYGIKTFEPKYNKYLLLMTTKQRSEFFELENDIERDYFIKVEGLELYYFLETNLKTGMLQQEVEKLLGAPQEQETILDISGKKIIFIYTQYTTHKKITYSLKFSNNKLVSWQIGFN